MKGIFLLFRKTQMKLICCFCIIGGCLLHTALYDGAEDALFPMMDATIVLDAGHGGWDPGRKGTTGVDEKELNLAVVEKLADYLEQGGAEVILTRENDDALGSKKQSDMAERKKIANESGADILVSIHQNAFLPPAPEERRFFIIRAARMGKCLRKPCRKACAAVWMAAMNGRRRKIRIITYCGRRRSLRSSWSAVFFPMQRRKNC